MACEQAHTVVHAYLDGELDAVRAAEFERHLEECSECVTALETQESLIAALHNSQLREKAPAALREKVFAATHSTSSATPSPAASSNVHTIAPAVAHQPRRSTSWSWLAAAAAILLLLLAGWRLLPALRGENYQTVVAAEIVDAHLRSLQPGHLTDVLSTDQHTVKPWFDGKLDFAPPVQDFANDGFPLQGGRLDVAHGRTIAALVYGRRKHLVSVFIWPATEQDQSLQSGSQQGYNWLAWTANHMQFCAVSDVSPADLDQLQNLFKK
jgi:mycothiol system anti-sigma-R factor